jgi:hypothetical protein
MLSVAEKNVLLTLIVTALIGMTGMKTSFKKDQSVRTASGISGNIEYNDKYEPYRINGLRI